MSGKPYLAHPVRGDVISPWIYDGSDWIKIGSPEYDTLREKMIADVMGMNLKQLDDAHGFKR